MAISNPVYVENDQYMSVTPKEDIKLDYSEIKPNTSHKDKVNVVAVNFKAFLK